MQMIWQVPTLMPLGQQVFEGGQSVSRQQLPGGLQVDGAQKTSPVAQGPQEPDPSHVQFVHSVQL
jgi:hypothetical protein